MNLTSEYDVRSLLHEQRMLELYRRGSANDGGLLEPLANACWRAAAFDWALHEDSGSIRRLWEEAARALTEGFVRKRAGFGRSPEELLLAVHFSISTRAFDLVSSLMHMSPAVPSKARGRRIARSTLALLDGYLAITRAVVERKKGHARTAQTFLEEARPESDNDWWREQFPSSHEVSWKMAEHEAIRGLLKVIARQVLKQSSHWETNQDSESDFDLSICMEFASLVDGALLSLDRFIESEMNHRPKLYFWLPGIALSILAERAGLPLEWLQVREEDSERGYARLPLKLVHQ